MKLFNRFKLLTYTDWICLLLILYILKIVFSYIASYSIDIQGVEFAFLHNIQLLRKHQPLYGNPDTYPFYLIFYPPLYSYFTEHLTEAFKINPFVSIHELLVGMRSLSLFFTLLNGWITLRILNLLSVRSSKRILLYLLFLLTLTLHIFAARPDSFKLFFFLLFLTKALRYTFIKQKKSTLLAATIYAVICIYIKHDAIVYILSYWFIYFLYFKKKNAIIAVSLLIFFILWGLTICNSHFGADFFRNIFYYNIQYSSDIRVNLIFILINVIRFTPLLYITWLHLKSENSICKFLAALAFIYFLFSNLTMLRPGANLNYTNESAVLLIINLGIYLHENAKNWKLKYEAVLIILLTLCCPYVKLNPDIFNKTKSAEEKTVYMSNLKNGDSLTQIIGTDTVFFTNPKYTIFNAKLNLLYGYDIHFDRYSELYFGVTIKPDIYSGKVSKEYDRYFTNGTVKYIVAEDVPKATAQMTKYYPLYLYYQKTGNLIVYKFNKTN